MCVCVVTGKASLRVWGLSQDLSQEKAGWGYPREVQAGGGRNEGQKVINIMKSRDVHTVRGKMKMLLVSFKL